MRTGVELTGGRLGAVRLDSGDLAVLAVRVREQLDSLGATKTRIVVTSDLDEYAIAALSGAPVDSYGVGTALVTGSGHPTCGFVYKLVARADTDDPDAPLVRGGQEEPGQGVGRRAQVGPAPHRRPRRRRGRGDRRRRAAAWTTATTAPCSCRWCATARSSARSRSRPRGNGTVSARAELPLEARKLSKGEPVIPTRYTGASAPAADPYAPKGARP